MACSLLGKSKRGVFSKACKLKNDSCKNFQMPAGWLGSMALVLMHADGRIRSSAYRYSSCQGLKRITQL